MIFGKNTYITALQQNYATGSDLFYLEQSTSVPMLKGDNIILEAEAF